MIACEQSCGEEGHADPEDTHGSEPLDLIAPARLRNLNKVHHQTVPSLFYFPGSAPALGDVDTENIAPVIASALWC